MTKNRHKKFISHLPPKSTYRIDEIAAWARVHYKTILAEIETGELFAVRVGQQFRIPADAFHDWQKRRSNNPQYDLPFPSCRNCKNYCPN